MLCDVSVRRCASYLCQTSGKQGQPGTDRQQQDCHADSSHRQQACGARQHSGRALPLTNLTEPNTPAVCGVVQQWASFQPFNSIQQIGARIPAFSRFPSTIVVFG